MENISWANRVSNDKVLQRVQENRKILGHNTEAQTQIGHRTSLKT